ncbi:hypothetical protein [Pontibacter sp. G13]|uniref:hypothetical protein n=1 Tax=Pontibacter sp. G13 TaxID=3074898 RepID=UPI00288BC469|nr:hypothetical protein [Pontibacter sp. G13]WNJ17557.1 hypothetical protein RJD25_22130 [Pontibacter sp. G13]
MPTPVISALFDQISQRLTFRARGVQRQLQPFRTGGLGNFPYYWQNPTDLAFNIRTFNWINANLKANTFPYEQAMGSTFLNLFIDALASISYRLSEADQQRMVELSHQILTSQVELMEVWNSIYGNPSSGKVFTIDEIFQIILNQWAAPPISMMELQDAADPIQLLNQMPAEGEPVIPPLLSYLLLLKTNQNFINAVSLYTGRLVSALEAAQNPTLENGAMQTTDGLRPAYSVSPSVPEIERQLNDPSAEISLDIEITEQDNDLIISVNGTDEFSGRFSELLQLEFEEDPALLESLLKLSDGSIKAKVRFHGLCDVSFHPVDFHESAQKYWFWMEPILNAINDENTDASGYHFLPTPNIDFGHKGPFGHIVGAVISKLPQFELELITQKGDEVQEKLEAVNALKIQYLEQLLEEEYLLTHQRTASRNGQQAFRLKLETAPSRASDRVAYVQGVYVDFPAETSAGA